MTILHTYIENANKGAEAVQRYLVTRNMEDLSEAIDHLKGAVEDVRREIQNPSLQKTKVQLVFLTSNELNKRILTDNAVSLPLGQYSLSGADPLDDDDIESGKFIRVFAVDQDPESAFLMKVTLVNPDGLLILAPVPPDPQ